MTTGWLKRSLKEAAEQVKELPRWARDLDAAMKGNSAKEPNTTKSSPVQSKNSGSAQSSKGNSK